MLETANFFVLGVAAASNSTAPQRAIRRFAADPDLATVYLVRETYNDGDQILVRRSPPTGSHCTLIGTYGRDAVVAQMAADIAASKACK